MNEERTGKWYNKWNISVVMRLFIYSRFDIRFTGVFSKIDSKSSLYSEIWLNWTLSNLEFCINQTLIKALM
jgi:hypothetical protein